MAALLPPSSVHGTFSFAFACFAITAALVYAMAEYVPRKYRIFHWLMSLMNGISALTYCVMASTYLGFVLVDDRPFFVFRYLDVGLTLPLMMLTLGLFSGTSLVETLYLTAASSLMLFSQLFCGLHPEDNRWFFFALNLVFYIPVASALSSGFRSQAELRHGVAVSARVSQLSLAVLLYTLILQLLVLLTEGLHWMRHDADTIAATLADLVTKLAFTTAILFSTDLTARAVEGDELLLRLLEAGGRGGEGMGEEAMETSVGGVRMKGGDPMHMKPEVTERSSLRGSKV